MEHNTYSYYQSQNSRLSSVFWLICAALFGATRRFHQRPRLSSPRLRSFGGIDFFCVRRRMNGWFIYTPPAAFLSVCGALGGLCENPLMRREVMEHQVITTIINYTKQLERSQDMMRCCQALRSVIFSTSILQWFSVTQATLRAGQLCEETWTRLWSRCVYTLLKRTNLRVF